MSVFMEFSCCGGIVCRGRTVLGQRPFASYRVYRNRRSVRSAPEVQARPEPSIGWRSGGRALGDLGQELVVALGGTDLVHQELESGGGAAFVGQRVQHPAELPHLLELGPV